MVPFASVYIDPKTDIAILCKGTVENKILYPEILKKYNIPESMGDLREQIEKWTDSLVRMYVYAPGLEGRGLPVSLQSTGIRTIRMGCALSRSAGAVAEGSLAEKDRLNYSRLINPAQFQKRLQTDDVAKLGFYTLLAAGARVERDAKKRNIIIPSSSGVSL